MIEKIYWLLEILAVLVCLSSINDKKIKIHISNVIFICIEMLFMQLLQDGVISRNIYFVVYFLYIVYALIEFEDIFSKTIFKCMLCAIILGIMQMIIYIPINVIFRYNIDENIMVLCINAVLLITVLVIHNNKIFRRIIDYCLTKNWLVSISVIACMIILGYCMLSIKDSMEILLDTFILIIVFVTTLMTVLLRWQKSNYEVKRREEELRLSAIYTEACEKLIDTTRKRQHEFNNHIDAVFGMHMLAKTYDELVKMQKEYCNTLLIENKPNSILSTVNNPVVAGFLYSKILKIEEKGIHVDYDISYAPMESKMSTFDIVEVIGILMDNATEAILENECLEKYIHFNLIYVENMLEVNISNPVKNITKSQAISFFEQGYSTKDKDRGIGLAKIKEYQKKYGYDIFVDVENDMFNISIILVS